MSALTHRLVAHGDARTSLVRSAMLVLLGSGVVALLAQLAVPLPFSPVPITGQTLGVLLVGAALGAARGALAIGAYLAEGALGLPVFAEAKGGAFFLTPASPTGGYLWGFVLAAAIVGFLAERGWDRSLGSAMGAMLAGSVAIYLLGVPWLANAIRIPGAEALELGLYPFVLGDLIKLAVAAAALPAAWRLVGGGKSANLVRDPWV